MHSSVDPPVSVDAALAKQQRKEVGRQRARAIAAERKIQEQMQRTSGGGTAGDGKGRISSRHGARNQHRHKNLTKWLVEKFPHIKEEGKLASQRQRQREQDSHLDKLADGQGKPLHVLDVAGGKGELAARLSMCHSISVVLVDPREADVPKCFDDIVLPKLPNKWQKKIEEQRSNDPNFVKDTVNQRVRQLVMTFDEYTVESCEEMREAVCSASLILGMHADGATEAIVDTALRYGRPFVVVPCCVFPRLFSQRYLVDDDGRKVQVRTHDQFCKYLLQKDRRFVMEILPFEGRNIAIWWDGEDDGSITK